MGEISSFLSPMVGLTLRAVMADWMVGEAWIRGEGRQKRYNSTRPLLENGVRVLVPPFISAGERIVVDTNEITYLRRAD